MMVNEPDACPRCGSTDPTVADTVDDTAALATASLADVLWGPDGLSSTSKVMHLTVAGARAAANELIRLSATLAERTARIAELEADRDKMTCSCMILRGEHEPCANCAPAGADDQTRRILSALDNWSPTPAQCRAAAARLRELDEWRKTAIEQASEHNETLARLRELREAGDALADAASDVKRKAENATRPGGTVPRLPQLTATLDRWEQTR